MSVSAAGGAVLPERTAQHDFSSTEDIPVGRVWV